MTTHIPASPHPPVLAVAPPLAVARSAAHALRVASWTCLALTPLTAFLAFGLGEAAYPDGGASTRGSVADALIAIALLTLAVAPPLLAFALSLMAFRATREVPALLPALLVAGAVTWFEVAAAAAIGDWTTAPWGWFAVAPALLAAVVLAVVVPRRR